MPFFRTGIAVAIPSVVSIQNYQNSHSMTSRRAKLHEDTNFRLMRILEVNPELSQREMGKALGISFGGINYCLNALVAKGLVKIENFSHNQNKFGYVYLLTPSGIAEKAALTSVFLKRKMEEHEALKVEIAILRSEIEKEEKIPSPKRGVQ
jgi:EPS-associated MarR family transcriptional regulator